jgi:hypothetical protein
MRPLGIKITPAPYSQHFMLTMTFPSIKICDKLPPSQDWSSVADDDTSSCSVNLTFNLGDVGLRMASSSTTLSRFSLEISAFLFVFAVLEVLVEHDPLLILVLFAGVIVAGLTTRSSSSSSTKLKGSNGLSAILFSRRG